MLLYQGLITSAPATEVVQCVCIQALGLSRESLGPYLGFGVLKRAFGLVCMCRDNLEACTSRLAL